jgi:hypothetical protein
LINDKYVTAPNNGSNSLIAQSVLVGTPEQFQIVDAGGGNIGFLALVNTQYVTAENNGASPLIANRSGVGSWETFTEYDAGGGNIALRAMNDGKFVTAPNGGANPIIAQSATIGTAESFSVTFVSGVPPSVPANVVATPGNAQAALSWVASAGASGYNVRRFLAVGGPYTVIATNFAGTAITDTGLVNGTTYYYVVSALNAASETAYSSPVYAIPGTLDRILWVASSSTSGSDDPGNALDGNLATRWSTGGSQTPGQWFQVDMGSVNVFSEIVLNYINSANDYPRVYLVTVSNDGVNWSSSIANGVGASSSTTITFAPQPARYIRITQNGSAGGTFWSIDEFNVFGTPQSTTVPQLVFGAVGGQLQFNWPMDHLGWHLEMQTNALNAGGWVTVSNSATTNQLLVPVDPTRASVFFRLAHP